MDRREMTEERSQERDSGSPFAVVTGASSGIGLELAREFARRGFDLLVTAENEEIVNAADELRTIGPRVTAFRTDLATFGGVEALWARIQEEGRPIDAIAVNAGVTVGGPFIENSLEDELNLINLNVASVVHLTKYVLRDMVARDEGRILITASIAAESPLPFQAVYAASKAFDLSFAEAIRSEVKDTNVVVTALMPGVTDTNIFRRAHAEDTKVAAGPKSDPAVVAREGIEALMKGKDHVMAAKRREKIKVTLGRVIPDRLKAADQRKDNEPGSSR